MNDRRCGNYDRNLERLISLISTVDGIFESVEYPSSPIDLEETIKEHVHQFSYPQELFEQCGRKASDTFYLRCCCSATTIDTRDKTKEVVVCMVFYMIFSHGKYTPFVFCQQDNNRISQNVDVLFNLCHLLYL